MSLLDNQTIEVTCPNCGKKFNKTIRWFKTNNQPCPAGCGATFTTSQFKREIDKIERAFSKLGFK